ncbi:MAG: apolipoprotein N-acyltransferase [Fodinibius sp.]|nr:apolipoprotein N-acyltransferase [Fodinibius sp.]
MTQFFDHIWNTQWVLALLAGLLLGLSWPPVPLPFLVFPAFLLIFRIIDRSRSAREAAYWTYPAFVIWNIITTYWLVMATVAGGVAAILANAAVMTIPVMLQYKMQKQKMRPWLIALLQTACWLSYEYLHHQWDLAWPWLTIGNAWANVPELVQYISVTGYWGITFWVIFVAALGYQLIKTNSRKAKLLLGSVFLLFPLWSLSITLFTEPTAAQTTQQVTVVQPNFDSYQPNGGFDNPYQAHDHLLELTDSVRTDSTQLVVYPENAIQAQISNLETFSNTSRKTKQLWDQKAKSWNSTIIGGATYFQFYDENSVPPLAIQSNRGSYLYYNSALGFYPDRSMTVYRKHNLVPIVERVPFVHFLNTVDLFGFVNWNRSQGYGKGKQAQQFALANTQTPALICYDSVYPSWIRKYVQQGTGFLTIITNDGWWGNTSGHEQHFAYARLRAIEFDRWIVRSANNGISGIIAPDGAIKVKTDYWTETAFRYDVPVLSSKTLYARFGDWLPILMLILTVGSVGFLGYERLSNSHPPNAVSQE